MADKDKCDLIKRFGKKVNYEDVLKLFDEMYPEDLLPTTDQPPLLKLAEEIKQDKEKPTTTDDKDTGILTMTLTDENRSDTFNESDLSDTCSVDEESGIGMGIIDQSVDIEIETKNFDKDNGKEDEMTKLTENSTTFDENFTKITDETGNLEKHENDPTDDLNNEKNPIDDLNETKTAEENVPKPLTPFMTLMKKADYMSSYGKYEDGLKIYKTLESMKTVEEGENTRSVQMMKQKIAGILHSQRKFDEAFKMLKSVLRKQVEILGDEKDSERPDVYETRLIIANVLESQGKLEESLPIYEAVYEAFSEFYGDEVNKSAHILFNIKSLRLKIAAKCDNTGWLDIETIMNIVDYGHTVFSIKYHWDDGRDTVLHRAVRTNSENIVQRVVDEIVTKSEGFDEQIFEFLNFENSELQTPLTLAVKYDCGNSVKYLLENGIPKGLDVNKITTYGTNALSLAEQRKNEEIKNMLLDHGAVSLGYRVVPN